MSEHAHRFEGLAAGYDRYRPDYPIAVIDFLISHAGLAPGNIVVDVGSGTGISTRQLAARGLTAIGVEPNGDMRHHAEAVPYVAGLAPTYCAGSAEATTLPDASAALVLVAQAFHWFANEGALREFQRILKPGGWVALVWNEQNRRDAFTGDYFEALLAHSPEPAIAGAKLSQAGELLLTSPLFIEKGRYEFAHRQEMDLEGLLGRAFSASYSPRGGEMRQRLEAALRALFERHKRSGRVAMRYRTIAYVGRKANVAA